MARGWRFEHGAARGAGVACRLVRGHWLAFGGLRGSWRGSWLWGSCAAAIQSAGAERRWRVDVAHERRAALVHADLIRQ